jgi:ankyrin repeat protein
MQAANSMSANQLHDAVRRGDLPTVRALLEGEPALANCRSVTDARGTFPLHVAAEFGQAAAARILLDHGADVSLLDAENDATALSWAAFFGRPAVVTVLLAARSDPSQRNKHGLTPLACALGGTEGRWKRFSNASLEEWQQCADAIRASGGVT